MKLASLTLLSPPFGGASVASATRGQAQSRDWLILMDCAERLVATGKFDGVHLTGPPEQRGTVASEGNAAFLQLADGEEIDESASGDEVDQTHRTRWTLTIAVRRGDPETRDREADRLHNVAQNALDGKSLDGITIPGWTKLRRWRWEKPRSSERRLTATGEWAYFVDDWDLHNTGE